MAIPAAPPLVIPRTRVRTIGGESFARETLAVDMLQQGTSDVQWMLRSIAAIDTAEQMRLGNPPSDVLVDNRQSRGFEDAQRKIEVSFGSSFPAAAMRAIEQTLRANIDRTTTPRSGRLHNVAGNWRWVFATPGQPARVVTSGTTLPPFTRGSMLILEPFAVPYSTIVNSLVVGSGVLATRKTKRKPSQSQGYLGATVRQMRGRLPGNFRVTVVFTQAHRVPGEISNKQGTGVIVVQSTRRGR